MCDAHIAPKKFNEIAFGVEKHLASYTREVASTVCGRSRRGLFKFQQTLYKTLQSQTNRDTVSQLDHAPFLKDYLTFIHYPKGVTTLKDNFFTKQETRRTA